MDRWRKESRKDIPFDALHLQEGNGEKPKEEKAPKTEADKKDVRRRS